MTRSLNERLIRTGRCSSRAMSSMFTMSSSRTVHLTQQVAEPVACAHHAHLERRHADAGHPRHLLVSQLFDVLEQERLSLFRAQLLEGSLDLLAPGRAVLRVLLGSAEHRRLVNDEGARAPA